MNAIGFFDLCVPEHHFTKENCVATLKALRQYGYRTVAINQVIKETLEPNKEHTKRKKKKGDPKENNELVPEPIKIDETVLKDFGDMTILNGLTVTFSDKDFYYKVTKSPNFKKYTILAVLPTTKIAFMFICTSVEADILTYCGEEKDPFRIDRNSYNHLIRKGFFFEILYGPTKEDSTIRKNTIHRSHIYHSIGKSRNIIVSSGVSKLIYLSSPYDVIMLGIIFGLNMQQAKDAVSHNGLELCPKAVGRCHGKSIVMVETIANDDISLIEIDDTVEIDEEISTVQIEDSDEETVLVDEPEPKKLKKK